MNPVRHAMINKHDAMNMATESSLVMSNGVKYLLITMEYPPDVGGVAEYYRGLVDALPEGSVRVLTPRDFRFFSRWFWPHWLPLFWNIWRTIRREKPDEVWVGQILPVGTVIYLLKKFVISNLKFQIFTHGMDILVPQRSRWKTWLMKRILGAAARVVANSELTRSEVVKLGVQKEKIIVVYPCVDIRKLNFPTEVQLPEVKNKKVLLTVARLVRRKGIDLVIEAVAKIKDQFPDLVYVIVGDGPGQANLKSQISDSGAPAILVGAVSEQEKHAWFELCDIFIMTPQQIDDDIEGFGIVYLEAGLHGKPAIGSRSGGVQEAIIDGVTGLLVPENDVAAITQAIIQLLTDTSLARQLGDQGRERVEKEFLWAKQIQKLAS